MNIEDRPSEKLIVDMRDHLLTEWGQAHSHWRALDQLYFGTFALWEEGSGRPEYHPARARSIVDHAVDHQLGYEPKVERFPAGSGELHKEKADAIEPWLKAVMNEAALLEPMLTWKTVGKHLVHYGYGVVQGPILDMRARPKRPIRRASDDDEEWGHRETLYKNERKTWMPFRIRTPHPSTILLDPLQKSPRFAVGHSYRYSYELAELTRKRAGKRRQVEVWDVGDNPFARVLCDEWWSKEWHAVLAEGGRSSHAAQLLFVERNTWGFVPYAHAFSGFGMQPTEAGEEGTDPSFLAAGILTPLMESLILQAQAVAGRHNALVNATFNKMGTTGSGLEMVQQLNRADVVEVPQGKEGLWWLDIPNLPGWMFEAERWLDQDIELGSFARSLAGIRPEGVSTVGQQAILSTAAGHKFVGIALQMEHLATVVAANILRLADVLDEPLYCRGYHITPADIEHDYSVRVSFDLVDPVLSLQERELGMREVSAGLKSRETYWSADARLQDATGERKRLLMDAVRADPQIHRLLAGEAAKELGILDLLLARERMPQDQNGLEKPPILGPDGVPLMEGTMGSTPIDNVGALPNPLPEGLTPSVPGPRRTNPFAFAQES